MKIDQTRKQIIDGTERLVLKVGSRLLAADNSDARRQRIEQLIGQVAKLRERFEVVLVSSGAIGAGMAMTGAVKRPDDVARLQGLAAIGQSRLMSLYENACQQHGFHCGQLLLSRDDVKERNRHLNVRNCLRALLTDNVLPIINENDTVSVDEIRFGDNDLLAALVATMLRADLTILLTTVDGFYRRADGEFTERLSVIDEITDEIRDMAQGTGDQLYSTGGMISKLNAAEITLAAGEHLWIADGTDFAVLDRILAGEDIGSLFRTTRPRMSGSKRWLAFFTESTGELIVDEGAVKAVCEGGRSLLPSGLIRVEGEFGKGDTVAVCAPDGSRIALGMTNYTAAELNQIKGLRSPQIHELLHQDAYEEAIHRDNMVLVPAGQ
jgi:glutamate 5-kinase